MFWEFFVRFCPAFAGYSPHSAQPFARPLRIPSCRYFGVWGATGQGWARTGEEGKRAWASCRGAGRWAAHADTLAGGRGRKAFPVAWGAVGQCAGEEGGRGDRHARGQGGRRRRGGSGPVGRQKNSVKSSAGRLAIGPRIVYLCSRGEEVAASAPPSRH